MHVQALQSTTNTLTRPEVPGSVLTVMQRHSADIDDLRTCGAQLSLTCC
jgi:hypothetical protein